MRSLLFVPASDRRKLDKGLASGADVIIVDLEDSVAADAKVEGRAIMSEFVAAHAGAAERPRLHVRINGFSTGLADLDLDAAVAAGADGIMLPKAAGGQDVTRLDAKIAVAEAIHGSPDGRTRIVAIATETAHAVFQAGTYRGASHRLAGLAWGAEDLSADLGATATRGADGQFLDTFRLARTLTLLGAVAAEVVPIDGVYTDFRDLDGLRAECEAAARDGFTAKMAIHPAQVPIINEIFAPSPAALAKARQIIALFDADADALTLLAALEAFDPGLDWTQVGFRKVEDEDWERAWLDQFQPMRFGARTFIVPWNHDVPSDAGDDAAIVRLDPGLAFGSGTHPTTALCLRWLDALAADGLLEGRHVLDFGCGSGILALAALKLGAAKAVGVDNDPQALLASADNAQRNAVDADFSVHLPDDEPVTTYPVVVANILASALDALAERLAARVAPGGRIALSGILKGQEDELLARYAPWFDALSATRDGDWMRIDGIRR